MSFSQFLVNGLIAGSIYALIAVGFSLIWKIVKIIDIAHGIIYALGAFLAYYFAISLKLNLIIAILISIVISCLIALLIHYVVYKPILKYKYKDLITIIASFGVYTLIQGLILLIFGTNVRTFNTSLSATYQIFDARITLIQLIIFTFAVISLVSFYLFLKFTKIGKAMRAVSDNKEASQILGINVNKIVVTTIIIGSAFASLAGIMTAIDQSLDYNMGLMAILKAITATIIGGIGNVPGTLFGGFILGLVENLGIIFLPSGLKSAIAFIILIIFLYFRPQGLFTTKKRDET